MGMPLPVSLGLAVALGAAALIGARVVLSQSAEPTAGPAAAPVTVAPQVRIVTAKAAIPAGAVVTAADLALAPWPGETVPVGMFGDLQAFETDDLDATRRVALVGLAPGEPLMAHKISGPGGRATLAAAIEPGFRAQAVRVSDVAGVGGHLFPGDRVDVILVRELADDGGERDASALVLLEDIRVLGVDLGLDTAADAPSVADTVTLEVRVEDGQRLALAEELGDLTLTLRAPGAADRPPTRPFRKADLDALFEPPPAPVAAPSAARRPSPPRQVEIKVIRGAGEPTVARVPREAATL